MVTTNKEGQKYMAEIQGLENLTEIYQFFMNQFKFNTILLKV